jgi:hypothetical protein
LARSQSHRLRLILRFSPAPAGTPAGGFAGPSLATPARRSAISLALPDPQIPCSRSRASRVEASNLPVTSRFCCT